MFAKRFEDLVTLENLKNAYNRIDSRASGIDDVSLASFETDLFSNLQQLKNELLDASYAPQPLERIEIAKSDGKEKRPIAIAAIRDKVVQYLLADALTPYFDPLFSNKSYAYRPDKSHIKAINRAKDYLSRGYGIVLRTDIDDFFETIDHHKLTALLRRHIQDSLIVSLIGLFIRNGLFHGNTYRSHGNGVHQGDVLSPLLSNLYLDQMDRFLDRHGGAFVRYADDFVVFTHSAEEAEIILKELKIFLLTIDLRLEASKTSISAAQQGFLFLGAHFQNGHVFIDPERIEKIREKIRSFVMQKHPFRDFIIRIGAYAKTLRLMYGSFVSAGNPQVKELDDEIWQAVSARIFLAKESGEITSKTRFRSLIEPLALFGDLSANEKKDLAELALTRGYERYHDEHPGKRKGRTDPLQRKKIEYAHAFARLSTIHITTPGLFIGMAKNRYTLKERGKVVQSIPKAQIERIIINAKGVTLSSSLVEHCSRAKIPIDFIDHSHTPYASILTHHAPLPQTAMRQYEIYFSGDGIHLAKEFIEGKAKNQINYLKYLDRYHDTLSEAIGTMEKILSRMKRTAQTPAEVMGYEGTISAAYWEALQKIVDPSWGFTARVTKGASDTVNSALNYGYAILYGKIQEALVRSGLSLYISYLHVPDRGKPTLVFDMIEEFRAFVVDRTIITMLNRNEPVRVDSSGKLTALARKKIAENIFERLGSYTTWKKESRKISTIIEYQSHLLARHIHAEERYNAFIGKY